MFRLGNILLVLGNTSTIFREGPYPTNTTTFSALHGPGGPTSISGNKQALSTGLDPGVLESHDDID